ncbi:MAG: hypothetical protein N4A72_19030 [Bacteroidales bacterium]|nr:hypothetical protein [Bacteroidales bacterium]
MTKKDLFRLIIKIFGLYSVISVIFSTLPSNFIWTIMDINLAGILWIIATVTIILSMFIYLIYKPDKIIRLFRLDKGFDNDHIEFQNFNTESILKLAVVVIGGILLIKNIPSFLSHALFAFKSSVQSDITNVFSDQSTPTDYTYLIVSLLNIVLGYLMITNYTYISRILKKKDDKNQSKNTLNSSEE